MYFILIWFKKCLLTFKSNFSLNMFTVKIIMIYLTILLMLLLCICEQIAPVVPLQDTFISYAICAVLLNTLKSLFSIFQFFFILNQFLCFYPWEGFSALPAILWKNTFDWHFCYCWRRTFLIRCHLSNKTHLFQRDVNIIEVAGPWFSLHCNFNVTIKRLFLHN